MVAGPVGGRSRPRTPPHRPGGADHHDPIRRMTLRTPREATELDTLLSIEQTAEHLGTSVRFVRRLIAERRIAYVKLGRHVRIAERDLIIFVATGRVEAGRRLGA